MRGPRPGRAGGGRKDEIETLGVRCHDVPFARSFTSTRNWRAYRELRRLPAMERYDLIYVHTPVAAWLTRLAARRAGHCPVLYTTHGLHFFHGAPRAYQLLIYPAERLTARWTDGLIVMSAEDFELAKRKGFLEEEDLFLVQGVGVDLAAFAPVRGLRETVRAVLGLAPGDFVVTCVAEFIPRKNHAQLLAAWPDVVREAPTAHLLLVSNGQLRAGLERRARELATPNVRLLGFHPDVPALLAGTDVLVLPSKREGLPRSVLEAMAAGRPVVATDVPGNRDMVEDGKTGILVKVGDANGLAGALVFLSRDAGLRQRMGEAGRAKACDYALDLVLEEMATVYGRYLGHAGEGEMG